MTLDETRFSHITVTPDDEDDVVIHAGAPAAPSGDEAAAEAAAGAAPERPSQEDAKERGTSRDEAFRETTIEDLEPSPMPAMQKAVIAVAVVLFAIAVAYLVTH